MATDLNQTIPLIEPAAAIGLTALNIDTQMRVSIAISIKRIADLLAAAGPGVTPQLIERLSMGVSDTTPGLPTPSTTSSVP